MTKIFKYQYLHSYIMNTLVTKSYKCKHCKSTTTIKYGKRRNRHELVQIFQCKSCGKFFSENTTYERTKLKEFAAKASVNLHSSGMSFRAIQNHLKEVYGINVSHVTIYYWVRKCNRKR